MSNEELKNRLEDLHQELEKAHTLSTEERDKFGSLLSDMVLIARGEGLEQENEELRDDETLREKLEHKASDFDVDHPRLASVIRQVLDTLGKMGI